MAKNLNISSSALILITIGTVVLCSGEDTAGSGDVAAKPLVCQAHEFSCLDGMKCIPDVQECDGLDDCDDSSDEGSHCQFFTCGDGSTVNLLFLCDGFNDCNDGSDEREEAANCTKFECKNGEKIARYRRCDGFNDCADEFHSDECDCDDTFTCTNQQCIPSYYKCDGVDDCGDNSDELMCDAFTGIPEIESKVDVSEVFKSPALFQCRNSKAVDSSLKCNGVDDCGDSSDECGCENRFVCDNGRCIDIKLAGNGIDDCGDDSDEEVVTTTTETPIDVTTMAGNTQHVTNEPGVVSTTSESPKPSTDVTKSEVSIAPEMFTCNNGRLINTSVLCDGTDDCMDEFRSDECDCERSFICSNKRCIDDHLVCDSVDDCGDCSDEIGCVDSNDKSFGMYFCHKGSCIRNSKVCDGHDDCVNGDDEFNCEAVDDVTTTTSSTSTTKKVIEEVLTEGTIIDVIEGSVDVTETDEKEIDVTIKHVDVASETTTISTEPGVDESASVKKTEEEEKVNPSEKDSQGPGGDAVLVTSHIMTIVPSLILLFAKLFIP